MKTKDTINPKLFQSTNLLAREVAHELQQQQFRVVFAESCTAGLVSAVLAQVAGISKWLCGSSVTYQDWLKQEWLQIDPLLLRQHTAVSPEVTEQMAEAVLTNAPMADFSVAITGHLELHATDRGPEAFVATAYRRNGQVHITRAVRYPLKQHSRVNRQWESARAALNSAMEYLRYPPLDDPDAVDWLKVCQEPTNYHWNRWF